MRFEKYILGVSETNWSYIKAVSGVLLIMTTTKTAMNTVGGQGIFGYGKNDFMAKFGRSRQEWWTSLQALSLAIVATTMLKDSYVSLDTAAKNAVHKDIAKEVF